jgi:hypothetical protein
MRLDLPTAALQFPTSETPEVGISEIISARSKLKPKPKQAEEKTPEGRTRADQRQKRKILHNTTQSTHVSSPGCAGGIYRAFAETRFDFSASTFLPLTP